MLESAFQTAQAPQVENALSQPSPLSDGAAPSLAAKTGGAGAGGAAGGGSSPVASCLRSVLNRADPSCMMFAHTVNLMLKVDLSWLGDGRAIY